MTFAIQRIDRSRRQQVESLGSKPKFWFDNNKFLFKAEHRGYGEDWAEVVASRLSGRLGLPHVEYELAAECDGAVEIWPGVVCANMAPEPCVLYLGNELLLARDPRYPKSQRFKVKQHTVDAVVEVMLPLRPPPGAWMPGFISGEPIALDVFVGYLLLDVWIANQDRHHENWGAIRFVPGDAGLCLAPTFDHAAGLARNLSDDERSARLETRDRGRSLAAFAARAKSKFFRSSGDERPLSLMAAFHEFAAHSPPAARYWLDRLRAVPVDQIADIMQQVPDSRMSEMCRRFTLSLLEENRRRLLELEIVE